MGSKRVHIRVGEDRRKKWKDHATEDFEDKYGSVSKLIRDAVETQMDIDKGNLSTGGSDTDAPQTVEPNGRIDDIKVTVEDNSDVLEDIEERLSHMHDTMLSQGGIPDDMLSDVYGTLEVVEGGFADADKDAIAREFGMTPSDVATEADISIEEAGQALVLLRYEYDDVDMLMRGEFDEPRYWVKA